MGYYADCEGYVSLKDTITETKMAELKELFRECGYVSSDESSIYVSSGDNYYEDNWYRALIAVTPYAEDGEFSFIGEDHSLWRYRFDNGTWYTDGGYIAYEPGEPLVRNIIASNTFSVGYRKRSRNWPEDRCPRCGAAMPDKDRRAISRIADCEICSDCGTKKALVAYVTGMNVALVDDWALLRLEAANGT